MKWLETRIPPVFVVLIIAALMWVLANITHLHIGILPYNKRLAALFLLAAIIIGLLAVRDFKRANTTVNPVKVNTASHLVTNGVFSYSRNPMYLAMLFMLIAWGFYLTNILALVFSFSFVIYMNRFQIYPEEQALRKIFPIDYRNYCQQVRRWL
ncbi:methyltransferase family protein [Catenovulum sediminis]|uniref:methyltransferase family protein n=1 Tax=Catenovulum sediminis TaxID=1740262 RepID=UPI00117E9DC9|nr:isoprenylcysteine carboxylmethyltransferase family protein [Catenovulum sediminis]